MKNLNINSIQKLLIATFFLLSLGACKKDLTPYDSKSDDAALATPADLQTATYGAYAILKTLNYEREGRWLMIYPTDNVALSGATGNSLYNAYTYEHFAGQANTTHFWQAAYAAIYADNAIIEKIGDNSSPTLQQLKGECLFLRALSHFKLVRFFGRPYTQDGGSGPGIPIKDSTNTDVLPSRSTVKEVYDFILKDLQNAADLMTVYKGSIFASKEAAYALLSRVYLYMGDNVNAIRYADTVINSNQYHLESTDAYKTYFIPHPEDNPETIFAIRNTIADNMNKSGIGNQFWNNPSGTSGYAETYASLSLVKLLNEYPDDVRHSFIELQRNPTTGDTLYRNGVPKIYVNKYNLQDGVPNLTSPVVLRLAEMYLNRAEANAKLQNYQEAIDDVNIIRRRAGLSGTALYTVDDLKGRGSVLNVVLEERRLEFFLEGQRAFDLFRNNLPLVRNYPGWHGTDHYHFTVNPDDNNIIYLIPQYAIVNNPNLVQNPD